MPTIYGDDFQVTVQRSPRRKTMALQIKQGRATLYMPQQAPLALAREFVNRKTPWIKSKLQQYTPCVPTVRTFSEGEPLLFLGQRYPLHLIDREGPVYIERTDAAIQFYGRQSCTTPAAIYAALTSWYRRQAQTFLLSRTARHAQQTGLIPRSVTVKSYKARWGSCHRSGDIQLNWKLIMVPEPIIEYVIIHELCHLRQHNHAPAFWDEVARFCPRYPSARQWLKVQGYPLLDF